MSYIYMIENKVNKHKYIGQTINPNKRWVDHKANALQRDEYLYRAMRKYGVDNFTFHILEEALKEDLDTQEQYYIALYNTFNGAGYNLTEGGEGYQKRHGKNPLAKPVAQYKTDGTFITSFPSGHSAAKAVDTVPSIIAQACAGYLKSAAGYQWRYFEDSESIEPYTENSICGNGEKAVNQYDLDGNFIKTHFSTSEASRETGINRRNIARYATSGQRTGNYQWRFFQESIEDILPHEETKELKQNNAYFEALRLKSLSQQILEYLYDSQDSEITARIVAEKLKKTLPQINASITRALQSYGFVVREARATPLKKKEYNILKITDTGRAYMDFLDKKSGEVKNEV